MHQRAPWTLTAVLLGAIISITSCGGGTSKPGQLKSSSAPADGAAAKATAVNPQALADGVYTFQSACNGKLLGLQNGKPAPWDNAVLRDAASGSANWQVSANGDGSFVLRAQGSQSALQTAYQETASETDVDLWTYYGDASQRWTISDGGNGTVKLALAAAAGMALDAKWAGTGGENEVWLYADNGSCAQRWVMQAVDGSGGGSGTAPDAFAMLKKIGRGINFGNALEASPSEGSWGVSLSEELFDKASEAGFATVRLPVRWSNYAQTRSPYAIDEAFFKRVDYAVSATAARGMNIVINMHHHRQLCGEERDDGEPEVDAAVLDDRFIAMWSQIAARYKDQPTDRVLFELYNEPNTSCTPQRWNDLLKRALAQVRKTNPQRFVVIGPASWNSADALKDLELPDDPRLIVTIHNYTPFKFTHQGADWEPQADTWLGTTCCDAAQTAEMVAPLAQAQAWAGTRWPIWLGEFGAYEKAPYDSRVRFTRIMRDEAEKRGFAWAYWEMAAGFGIWDPKAKTWRTELKDALVGQ